MEEQEQAQDAKKPRRLEQNIGIAVLVLLLIGCAVVMKPFVSALMWAAVLAFSLWPIQHRLTALLRNRRTLSAAITTITIALVLVVPFIIIGVSVASDVRALGAATRKWVDTGPPPPPKWVEKIPVVGGQAKKYWQETADDLGQLLQKLKRATQEQTPALTNKLETAVVEVTPIEVEPVPDESGFQSKLIANLGKLIATLQSLLLSVGLAIGRGAVEVTLSVFLLFFILRDGAVFADRLNTGVGRIAGERGKHLLLVAGKTVRGVVYGILGTALVQGGMAGIGFLIAGVPGAVLLGLLTFFLSVVPVGPPMVWIPAAIWLFQQGSPGWAIFMVIWGIGVSSIDNVVKPWLISQGSKMPFILIFFGVLGGALAFGVIGVFLGPTLLAVAYRIIEEWSAVAKIEKADESAKPASTRSEPPPEAPPPEQEGEPKPA